MRERLQQGRNKQNLHPSDSTLKNIVIENPIAQKIDPTGYVPDYKDRSFNDLDRSLPGQTALKTGLNNSQNYKIEKEESRLSKIETPNLDDSRVHLRSSGSKEKPKKKRIVKQIKPKTKLDQTLKSETPKIPVKRFDDAENEEEAKSVDESLHTALPKFLKFEEQKKTEAEFEETKQPENYDEDEDKDMNDRMEQTQKEEEPREIIIPGERPGSPIIPALRKKLLQSHTITLANEDKNIKQKGKPKRSVTQIGQGEEALHIRNKSVTKLGIEDKESEEVLKENKVPPQIQEESKDFGKPPLAQSMSYGGNSKKLIDGIEAEFQAAKHRKFTDIVSLNNDREDRKELNKVEPITARKEYYSDDEAEDKKISFRKYVLGAPEYNKDESQLKESSSEQDISLMHGLPASMK